ncbi:MAG TPA: carbon-nitrogen hydrolase family protein [Flavitalea sp.]|nr:carbon-nitrogen hydrolase family protein [Flavitalea sp.]
MKLISSISLLYITLFCGTVTGQEHEIGPSEWKFESQRKEIAPVGFIDSTITYDGKPTLSLAGGGKEYSNGHWYIILNVEPGQFFQFRSNFIASNVEEPARSILARIIWRDSQGKKIGTPEYPASFPAKTNGSWNSIKQLYKVPEDARQAKIELVYRWDANGIVHFAGTSLEKTTAPEPRIVKVAAIHHRPRNSKSSLENLAQFSKLIDKAANQRADIVCLPEGITLVGTTNDYISASEHIPGPTTEFLGKIARKYKLYIVAGILERNGDTVFNTAVLIDRNGNFAGKYRKVSLPQEEIDGGITPGNSFPVFDTDFGKIGLMICWDVTFPEPARALAQKGAEIIFLPIWGGDTILTKARAIENQVYVVSSTYDMISAVFDQEGMVMKEATEDNSVIVVDVDLNKQKLWPWLGDLKSRIFREIPPRKSID